MFTKNVSTPQTPLDWVDSVNQMANAAYLLLTTHDSIGNIAEAVGIDSPFYFSLLFKKKYFISPLEYRREFKGIQEK